MVEISNPVGAVTSISEVKLVPETVKVVEFDAILEQVDKAEVATLLTVTFATEFEHVKVIPFEAFTNTALASAIAEELLLLFPNE